MRKSITTTLVVVVVLMLLYYALVLTEGVGVVLPLQQKGEISKRSCNQNELKALIKLRDSLIDHSNRLSSWFGEDCCSWKGVGCSKGTGNVVELDLHNPVLYYSDSNYDTARMQGEIIPSLLNLKHLQYIDLQGNNFSEMLIPKFFSSLNNLIYLNLSRNSFQGPLPTEIGNVSQLTVLDLSANKFSGFLPNNLGDFKNLEYLDLYSNSFIGSIPLSLGQLSKLEYLDISHNFLDGSVNELHFLNLTRLNVLYLSENLLVWDVSPQWVPPFQLRIIFLNSLKLGPQFPPWLQTQRHLENLLLRNTRISDAIPDWFEDLYSTIEVLDISHNQISGKLPKFLGSLRSLFSLHLNSNRFHGKIPLSLHNLTNLQHLDLSENEFNDIIPPWIGENLSSLKFLSLQSNRFYGDIPLQLCHLSSLQVLNLARNSITGCIPRCFGNFSAMTMDDTKDSNSYMRGRQLEYTGSLRLLKSIDLSNNHIVGEIPEELMDLSGLKILNLSGNYLNGRIHENIGNLKQLNILDLSRNKLSGPIPPTLSALNFLSYLNLSFNNLSGRIPTGNQLQTLNDPSIYMGNTELCGLQVFFKNCLSDTSSDSHEYVHDSTKDEYDSELLAFYAGIGPGFLVGFLGVCGVLHFKKSWRYAFFQFVENTCNNLLVAVAVKIAWLQNKFHKDEMEE